MLMDGRAQATGIRRPAGDATLLWVLNAHHEPVPFSMPEVAGGRRWSLVFDTAVPDPPDDQRFAPGDIYESTGRSCQLFALHGR
jgi:isoamylase